MFNIDLEICINSSGSEYVSRAVEAAETGGSQRIELCGVMDQDGLTPAREHIEMARHVFSKPGLLTMVRPRGGGFCYSRNEADVMAQQIRIAAIAGANGVVFGMVRDRDNAIDETLLARLVDVAKSNNLEITFHRAFDATPEVSKSLDVLLEYGVDRVLTSGTAWGSKDSAIHGIPVLESLIRQAGRDIEVVVGGGLSPNNLAPLLQHLPIGEGRMSVHSYGGVLDGNQEVSIERVRCMANIARDMCL